MGLLVVVGAFVFGGMVLYDVVIRNRLELEVVSILKFIIEKFKKFLEKKD